MNILLMIYVMHTTVIILVISCHSDVIHVSSV